MSQLSMSKPQFNTDLMDFIRSSPDPFHATRTVESRLLAAGYAALDSAQAWQLEPGGRYFTTRNDSAIIAFTFGSRDLPASGIRMTGAHTDSPCLKLKPQPVLQRNGYLQLGIEVYGGALFNPWFDRDLSLSGRVDYLDADGKPKSCLLNLEQPLAVIPSLAIHLDREANLNRSVNPQLELVPLLMTLEPGETFSLDDFLLQHIQQLPGHDQARKVLSHELCFYDTQPPALTGLRQQFISSARLDNLLSCHVCLQALLETPPSHDGFSLIVFNDHEEVGSRSTSGADGPFLRMVLDRMLAAATGGAAHAENFERMIRNSMFLSVDNAHGVHPNYSDKHDGNHGPLLNKGPVLKINANQRYASNSHSTAIFRSLCEQEGVPVQSFAVRADMGCGSTIGPITAAALGVETVDIGVPTFAMHSIRELAGADDAYDLTRVIRRFFAS